MEKMKNYFLSPLQYREIYTSVHPGPGLGRTKHILLAQPELPVLEFSPSLACMRMNPRANWSICRSVLLPIQGFLLSSQGRVYLTSSSDLFIRALHGSDAREPLFLYEAFQRFSHSVTLQDTAVLAERDGKIHD